MNVTPRTGATLVVLAIAMLACSQPARAPTASAGPGTSPAGATSPSPGASVAAPATVADARVPGEFTACVRHNAELDGGTNERIVVPHPDGDMTLERTRGHTWSGAITATDERFSGTHTYSWDNDGYTLASGEPGPRAVAEGHRIENDEGAWQGWSVGAGLSEDAEQWSPVYLTGGGAYEGLTAILVPNAEAGCVFSYAGVVMEFPEPLVPATSDVAP